MTVQHSTVESPVVQTAPDRAVRELYGAFARGDFATIDALLDDDVVFHVPGRSANTGTYRGKTAVFEFFASASATTGGTLRLRLHDVAVGNRHVVAIATYRASRDGRAPLENNLAHVLTFRDGRIAESWFHSRDQYDVDAFWS